MSSDVELIGDSPTDVDWHEAAQTVCHDDYIERLKNERDEALERQVDAEKKLANEVSRAVEMETRLSASKHQIAQLEKKIILDQNVNRQKLKSLQTSLNDICERVKISDQSVYKARLNQSLNEERLKTLENMLKIKDQALLAAETALVAAQKKISYNSQSRYQTDESSLIRKLLKRIDFCKSQVRIVVEQFVQDKEERKWALECIELENRINELEAALQQESWSKLQTNNKLAEINQQLLDAKSEFSRRESILLNNEKMAQDRYENHMKLCCKQEEQLTAEINKLKAKLELTESRLELCETQLRDAQNELENIAVDIFNVDDQSLPNSKRQRQSQILDKILGTIQLIAGNIEKSFKQELGSVTSFIEKIQYDKMLNSLNDEIRKGFESMRHQAPYVPIDSIPQETIKKLIVKCQIAEDNLTTLENSKSASQEMIKKLIVKCQAAEERVSQLTKQLENKNGKSSTSSTRCLCSHVKYNGKFGHGWSISKHARTMESLAILNAKLSRFKGDKSDIIPQDIAELLYKMTESLYDNGEIKSD